MAVNTTRQGANFELDVLHYLTGCECATTRKTPVHVDWHGFGYDCLRSSGSRGAVDVVAVGPEVPKNADSLLREDSDGGPLLFIQCKITNPNIGPADRNRVQDLATRAGAVPLVAYRAKDTTTGRMRPHFRLLTGPGPKDWLLWEPVEGAEIR